MPGPQGNPGQPGDLGPPGLDGSANTRNDASRFIASDIGFFDPFYNDKSHDTASGIKHADKDTYFRDITIFINQIKNITRVKKTELLRNNLQIYLRGEALE